MREGLRSKTLAPLDDMAVSGSISQDSALPLGLPPNDLRVTVPSACSASGLPVSWDSNTLGARMTWVVEGGLVDVGTSVLNDYQAIGTFELAQSGYLDLLGSLWGCVVVSCDGWVELVFVNAQDEGTFGFEGQEGGSTCAVTVVRLGQDDAGPQGAC